MPILIGYSSNTRAKALGGEMGLRTTVDVGDCDGEVRYGTEVV